MGSPCLHNSLTISCKNEVVATVEQVHEASARKARPSAGGIALMLGALALLLLVGLAVRSNLVFGLVVLAAIFVPMEQLFAARRHRVFRKRWASDLVHFVFNNLLGTVGVVAGVVVVAGIPYLLMPDVIRAAIAAQPTIVQFLEALAIVELCGYWAHRATHTVPFLWRFHKVHHSIEEMDWLAAGRLHPLDQVFTRTCVVAPLFVLGFSRATFGAFLVFTALHAIFIHANVRFSFGPLRWVIGTPEYHHWHHSNEPQARNTNFAGEMPLLDAIFGTQYLPARRDADGNAVARFPSATASTTTSPTATCANWRGRSAIPRR